MKKSLLLIIVILFCSQLNAQIVNIPDPVFKARLLSRHPSIDQNHDGEIQESEAQSYSGTIDVSRMGPIVEYFGNPITNLTGIEAFTSITSLDCSFNAIQSINLQFNTSLDSLNVFNNHLFTLDLSYNTELMFLVCSYNQYLECLNVKNGTNSNFDIFHALHCNLLNCIQVDDSLWSEENWQNVDPQAYFSMNCPELDTNTEANCLTEIITLSNKNTPQPNNRYYYDEVITFPNLIDTIGENMTWDYSHLQVKVDSTERYYTKDTSYNSFPDTCFSSYPSNYDTTLLRTKGAIYRLTEDIFKLAFKQQRVYCAQEYWCDIKGCVGEVNLTQMVFPFTYNDVIHEEWECGYGEGDNTVKAVNYGTLILPDTVYCNTLLLYKTLEENPKNSNGGHLTTYRYETGRYEWYTESSEVPVFYVEKYNKYSYYYMDGVSNVGSHLKSYIYTGKTDYTGIESIEAEKNIKLYPNPTDNIVWFESESKLQVNKVLLVNIQGQMVKNINRPKDLIDISDLQSGLYLAKFYTNQGVVTKRVIKQ